MRAMLRLRVKDLFRLYEHFKNGVQGLVKKWLLRLGLVGIVTLFVFTAISGFLFWKSGEIYEYQDTVDGVNLPDVDAIVCLAGGKGRIAASADIWYRYWELSQVPLAGAGRRPVPDRPPVLYISGMGPQANWKVFIHRIRRGLIDIIHPSDVVLETESANTRENAMYFSAYAAEHHWKKILLMTSRYHMRRSKEIFEEALNSQKMSINKEPVQIETLSVYAENFDSDEWRSNPYSIQVTVSEYLKWLHYLLMK